jgi:hypothetical protein
MGFAVNIGIPESRLMFGQDTFQTWIEVGYGPDAWLIDPKPEGLQAETAEKVKPWMTGDVVVMPLAEGLRIYGRGDIYVPDVHLWRDACLTILGDTPRREDLIFALTAEGLMRKLAIEMMRPGLLKIIADRPAAMPERASRDRGADLAAATAEMYTPPAATGMADLDAHLASPDVAEPFHARRGQDAVTGAAISDGYKSSFRIPNYRPAGWAIEALERGDRATAAAEVSRVYRLIRWEIPREGQAERIERPAEEREAMRREMFDELAQVIVESRLFESGELKAELAKDENTGLDGFLKDNYGIGASEEPIAPKRPDSYDDATLGADAMPALPDGLLAGLLRIDDSDAGRARAIRNAVLSRTLQKKWVLIFDVNLNAGGRAIELMKKGIEDIRTIDPVFADWLDGRIEIKKGLGSVKDYKKPEDLEHTEVIVFARKEAEGSIELASNMRLTLIDERDGADEITAAEYYPLFEIVAYSLAEFTARGTLDTIDKSALNALNIEDMVRAGNTINCLILPKAKRHDIQRDIANLVKLLIMA